MPMIWCTARRNIAVLGCTALGVVLPGFVMASDQAVSSLSRLTVPPSNLPEGCRVRPIVPAVSPAQVGGTTVLKSNPGPTYPFPANPWVGTEQGLLVYLLGPPPIPDAPPPSGAELRQFEARWVQHVREGYRAQYATSDGRVIEVMALQFDDAGIPTTSWPSRAEFRFGNIAAVVRSPSGPEEECTRAIKAHIRVLRD